MMASAARLGITLLVLLTGLPLYGQIDRQPIAPIARDTVQVIPGEHHAAGSLHRTIYGDLWRDLWTTPIDVPVLDLQTTGGGLRPTMTDDNALSLRFEGDDGRSYTFRPIDIAPATLLPNRAEMTFAEDLVQDLASAGNPVGSIVVAPLLDAVDIVNARPYLVVLPDDPVLGQHRTKFAGMLGTFAEYPSVQPDGSSEFYGFARIDDAEAMAAGLRRQNTNRVDRVDYLKSRLVDYVINDWGRAFEGYRWGLDLADGTGTYRPIYYEQGRALSRYDGLLPWTAAIHFREIEGIDNGSPSIEDLTWNGRLLDRRFLAPIGRQQWDSTTAWVISQLSDAVIAEGITRMPPAIRATAGAEITRLLATRRASLSGASDELYRLVRSEPELRGSDGDEYVLVERFFDEEVRVSFYRRDPASGQANGDPYLVSSFRGEETDEIRIRLLDGNDKAVVTGEVPSSIDVRIDGGAGIDELVDESKVSGTFLITPIPDAETSTWFYDSDEDSRLVGGPSTSIDRTSYPEWNSDTTAWHPPYRNEGSRTSVAPWLSLNSDEGLFLGLSLQSLDYGFRQPEYETRTSIGAGYAFGTNAFTAAFDGEFRAVIPGSALFVSLFASDLAVLSFYDYGNRTGFDTALDTAGYYDIAQRQFTASFDLRVPRSGEFGLSFGLEGSHIRTRLEDSPIRDSLKLYGIEPITLLGARLGIELDHRDAVSAPTSGVFVAVDARLYPELLENRVTFAVLEAEARTYLSWEVLRPTTLALRGRVESIFGEQNPYFKAAFLGGNRTLRGYPSNRFAGDRSLLGNAELRMHLFDFSFLTRNRFGIVGFAEGGRVFFDGEFEPAQSFLASWHWGYGGGIALSIIEPDYLLVFTVGESEEQQIGYYINLGYMF